MSSSGDRAGAPTAQASAVHLRAPEPPPPTPPQPALVYDGGTRAWPWDVKVVVVMSIVWAAIQILYGAVGLASVARQRSLTWAGSSFTGWLHVLGILLRSLLPTLLIIGLVGLLKFKPGARRLSLLVAGAFVAFGTIESLAQFASVLAQRTYVYELPGYVLGVVQNFIAQNALAIVLSVMLVRADVKLLAPDA